MQPWRAMDIYPVVPLHFLLVDRIEAAMHRIGVVAVGQLGNLQQVLVEASNPLVVG